MQSSYYTMLLPSKACTYCGHHPVFFTTTLQCYDDELRKILCSISNICLDEAAWTRATRPIRLGGLGIRNAVQLAPSAFLASAHHPQDLVHKILPPRLLSTDLLHNLCVVTGPSATSSSGQSILLPEGMGQSKGRGNLCSFVRPSLWCHHYRLSPGRSPRCLASCYP